jgi:hypothetical protein
MWQSELRALELRNTEPEYGGFGSFINQIGDRDARLSAVLRHAMRKTDSMESMRRFVRLCYKTFPHKFHEIYHMREFHGTPGSPAPDVESRGDVEQYATVTGLGLAAGAAAGFTLGAPALAAAAIGVGSAHIMNMVGVSWASDDRETFLTTGFIAMVAMQRTVHQHIPEERLKAWNTIWDMGLSRMYLGHVLIGPVEYPSYLADWARIIRVVCMHPSAHEQPTTANPHVHCLIPVTLGMGNVLRSASFLERTGEWIKVVKGEDVNARLGYDLIPEREYMEITHVQNKLPDPGLAALNPYSW